MSTPLSAIPGLSDSPGAARPPGRRAPGPTSSAYRARRPCASGHESMEPGYGKKEDRDGKPHRRKTETTIAVIPARKPSELRLQRRGPLRERLEPDVAFDPRTPARQWVLSFMVCPRTTFRGSAPPWLDRRMCRVVRDEGVLLLVASAAVR